MKGIIVVAVVMALGIPAAYGFGNRVGFKQGFDDGRHLVKFSAHDALGPCDLRHDSVWVNATTGAIFACAGSRKAAPSWSHNFALWLNGDDSNTGGPH